MGSPAGPFQPDAVLQELSPGGLRIEELPMSEEPMAPAASDPPERTRFRRILRPFFSPRRVAMFEPGLRRFTNELIDGFIGRGACHLSSGPARRKCPRRGPADAAAPVPD